MLTVGLCRAGRNDFRLHAESYNSFLTTSDRIKIEINGCEGRTSYMPLELTPTGNFSVLAHGGSLLES